MKRKTLYLLLAVMLFALIPLTGCGSSEPEDNTAEIRAAAEGFLNAMEAGDMEVAKEYADPAIFEEGGDLDSFATIDSLSQDFAESMGVDEKSLSDRTREDIQEFMDTLLQNLVTSYEITDVTENDGKGSVHASITYGYDPDKMQEIDLNDEIGDMAEKYTDEHMDELTEIYQKDGQEAMISKLLDAMMGEVLKKYTDAVMETGEVTQDAILTLEKQDDKWVVTGEKPAEKSKPAE